MAQLDSQPQWRRIRIPLLAPYGGKDLNLPTAKTWVRLKA